MICTKIGSYHRTIIIEIWSETPSNKQKYSSDEIEAAHNQICMVIFEKNQTMPDKTQWMGGKCVFIVAWESSSLSPYVNTLQSMMLFLRKSEMNIKFEICWRNVSGLLIFRLYTKICRLSFPVFFYFFTCRRWMVKSSKNIRASKLLHFGDSTKCEW